MSEPIAAEPVQTDGAAPVEVPAPAHSDTSSSTLDPVSFDPHETATKDFGFIPIPMRLRHDPRNPINFGLAMNVMFGFCGTFVLGNLYYCQPLLIQFSDTFNVTYDEVSRIPTLIQVGYLVGIIVISTLGDLVRRRPLLLALIFVSASITVGLAFTTSLPVFEALCFLVGMSSVVPQILLPLAADLAPPERRATAMSIVLSGLLLGILIARVLAGTIAQYVTWRVVYYQAFAVQYILLIWFWFGLPDYPARNQGATYFGLLWGMVKYAVTEPILVQTVFVNLPGMACYSSFWVTLTFLLGGAPYHYSTLVIGLFGVVGIVGVAMAPVLGRIVDKLVPWFASLIAIVCFMITLAVGVIGDGLNIAPVVIVCIGIDVFRQMVQVSLTTAVFSIDPAARSRLNAVILISLFLGQIMGTSVGTQVFTEYGWRPTAALSLAWSGFMLFVILIRGPHVPRHTWFGWKGGLEVRKSKLAERQKAMQQHSAHFDIESGNPVNVEKNSQADVEAGKNTDRGERKPSGKEEAIVSTDVAFESEKVGVGETPAQL